VAREEVVLKIRFARLMAWMKRTDLSLVHYPGWTAFVVAHSYWKESWTREMIRFVESGLDHIMMLVACRVIPLTLGIRAAKAIPPRPPRLDEPPLRPWAREPKPPTFGDWIEPKDQDDCMAQLGFVWARLDERRMILGMGYVQIKDNDLWRDNFYGRETLEIF